MTPDEKDELRKRMARIETQLEQRWEDLYHDQDPKAQAYGERTIVTLADGSTVADEKTRANAHPGCNIPCQRPD